MLQKEHNCEQTGATVDTDETSGKGDLDTEYVAHSDCQSSLSDLNREDFFISEKWHKPYAEALMEAEPARLSSLILEAEHAIFSRYLELCECPGPIEYSRDLRNATDVLIQLKKAKADT